MLPPPLLDSCCHHRSGRGDFSINDRTPGPPVDPAVRPGPPLAYFGRSFSLLTPCFWAHAACGPEPTSPRWAPPSPRRPGRGRRLRGGGRPAGAGGRRSGHPVEDVSAQGVVFGHRRMVEVVGRIVGHGQFLHHPLGAAVDDGGERDDLLDAQPVEAVGQEPPGPPRWRSPHPRRNRARRQPTSIAGVKGAAKVAGHSPT